MPKIVDRDAYREELLENSFRLFAEHGYASLTLRKLSKELGVSTGTLYHYFSGKEDIFAQLVDLMTDRVVEAGVAQVSLSDNREQQIRAVVRFVEHTADIFGDFMRVGFDATRMPNERELTQSVLAAVQRLHQAIADVVEGLSHSDAVYFFDTMAGVVLRQLLKRSAGADEKEAEEWRGIEDKMVAVFS
jgi:AcrR family transcriptional regulator